MPNGGQVTRVVNARVENDSASRRMLRLRFTRRRWDERGAVAVVVALCSLVIFAVAALAVDLGNGFARKRDTQNQADFAALAGARSLPARHDDASANDEAVKEAAKYLVSEPATEMTQRPGLRPWTQLTTMLDGRKRRQRRGVLRAFLQRGPGPVPAANFVPSVNELTVVTPPRSSRTGWRR